MDKIKRRWMPEILLWLSAILLSTVEVNSAGNLPCKVDLVLMIDTSNPMDGFSTTHFQDWGEEDMVRQFLRRLPVDSTNTHISIVTFSDIGILHWTFNDPQSAHDIVQRLNVLEHQVGLSDFSAAFDTASEAFDEAKGARADARKIAVLITDDRDRYDKQKAMAAAENLRSKARLIVLGVGPYVDRSELDIFATSKAAWEVADFFDTSVLGHLAIKICPVKKCGGRFKMPGGSFKSPSYLGRYMGDLHCRYIINQPKDRTIIVNFTSFSLEGSAGGPCLHDYVEVSDGKGAKKTKIGRFCGNALPVIHSNTSRLALIFVSDMGTELEGFTAEYTTIQHIPSSAPTPAKRDATPVLAQIDPLPRKRGHKARHKSPAPVKDEEDKERYPVIYLAVYVLVVFVACVVVGVIFGIYCYHRRRNRQELKCLRRTF